MSDSTFTRRINIYIDSGQANAAQEVLLKKQEALTASIKKYTDAGKEIPAKLTKDLETCTAALDRQNKKISGELSPSLRDLSSTVVKLRRELAGMSEQDPGFEAKRLEYNKAKGALDSYSTSLVTVKEGLKNMLKEAKGVAVGVLVGGTIQAAVQTALSGIQSIGSLRIEFEGKVRNLSAITGATGGDLEYLKQRAIELSTTSTKSASDFIEAMKLIGSAKPELLQDAAALAEVTKQADRLAKASGLDLPDAATRLTDAMNQYGADASQAAKYVDVLAAAAKYGAAEVPGITEALLEFGPVAKQSNISITESAAAIELLAEKGVKGAEAGTKLRNVFLAMSAVDSLPANALEQLKKYGVNTELLQDKTKSLAERLTELSKVSGDANAMMQIFDKQNIVAGQILLSNIPRYAQLAEQVKEVGVASTQAAENTATLSSAWARFTNTLTSFILGIDNSGLTKMVQLMTSLISKGEDATEMYKKQRDSVDVLNTSIAPLLTRYDELKGKATLNAVEQGELNTIIEKIGKTIPTAISGFDEYGKALGINTSKAREFVKEQQAILAIRNKDAITHNKYLLDNAQSSIKGITQTLNLGYKVIQDSRGLFETNVKLSSNEIQELQQKLADLQKQKEGYLGILKELRGDNLNGKQPTDVPGPDGQAAFNPLLGNKESNKKETAEADKTAAYIKKLREELHLDRLTDSARELEAIRQKYAHEREEAKGNKEALAIIDQLEALAVQEWSNKNVKAFEQVQKSKLDITKMSESQISDIIFTEEEKRELASKKFAEEWKKAIQSVQQEFSGIQSMVSGSLSFISTIFSGLDQKENQELARDKKRNDTKAAHYKHLLDTKKISQKTYDAAIHNMDKEADAKKAEIMRKQFERNKAIQIVQTIANTAAAVVAQLANPTPYVGIVLAALAAATGVAQIAVIAAQEPPSFGGGTEAWRASIGGDKHSDASGGNPIIDGTTGAVLGKVEAKEAFIPADSAEVNQAPIKWMLNNRGKPLPNFNVSRSIDNVQMYANGTGSYSSSGSSANYSTVNTTDSHSAILVEQNKQMIELLKEMKEKKIVFSKYDYDTFNERNDFSYQRTSIG